MTTVASRKRPVFTWFLSPTLDRCAANPFVPLSAPALLSNPGVRILTEPGSLTFLLRG
jgi:hypothetical protein